jgi:phage shock protein C
MREKTMNNVHDWFRRQGLVRPRQGRVLAGVGAGLGRRVGIDPWPARLLFLLLVLALHGSPIVFYVILWILMPVEETAAYGTASPEPPTSPAR